jgi:hypothetical protein
MRLGRRLVPFLLTTACDPASRRVMAVIDFWSLDCSQHPTWKRLVRSKRKSRRIKLRSILFGGGKRGRKDQRGRKEGTEKEDGKKGIGKKGIVKGRDDCVMAVNKVRLQFESLKCERTLQLLREGIAVAVTVMLQIGACSKVNSASAGSSPDSSSPWCENTHTRSSFTKDICFGHLLSRHRTLSTSSFNGGLLIDSLLMLFGQAFPSRFS